MPADVAKGASDGLGGVGRTGVDHDHLVGPAQALQCAPEVLRFVEGKDEGRYPSCSAVRHAADASARGAGLKASVGGDESVLLDHARSHRLPGELLQNQGTASFTASSEALRVLGELREGLR